jgi:hypothetical protein
MTRHLDPRVKELDDRILSLKNEGLTYKEISTKLNLTNSRCRLAGKRTRRRKYLRNYLRKYRDNHPDFYKRLKRKVKENYNRRIRSDHQFRIKRNNQAKMYRTLLFGKKRLKSFSDFPKVFRDSNEIVSTKTLVERLGKPSYYYFYSRLKVAITKRIIERKAWGRYSIVDKSDTNEN